MLSGPTNLQCPACGDVFMSVQSRPDGNETCPRCAFVGPRAHYRALTQSLGAEPVRFQKRIQRAHEPEQASPATAVDGTHATHMSHPTNQPRMTPAPWQGAQTGQQDYEPAIEPAKKSSLGFWLAVSVVFIAVCGFTGLLAWEKINQRIRQLSGGKSAGAPAMNTSRSALPSAKAYPLEYVNQRMLTGAAMAGAERLINVLFNSATTADRLKAVADPARHQAEVAAMFDNASTRPALIALTPITNPPLSLATQQRMPMFKVVTSLNKSGALISTLTGGTGEPAINWPLFRETHDGLLARHIGGKSRQPQWFHVGLRRFHSFELPKNVSGEFDAIDIDGSTDGGGHIVTYVAKESPLGRHLARNVEWDKFYFGRVLVSWMDIAGEMRPALLDCEGAGLPGSR